MELSEDRIPDETTIVRFRHLLEKHDLTEAISEEVKQLLTEKRLYVKAGTFVHVGTDTQGLVHSLTTTDAGAG